MAYAIGIYLDPESTEQHHNIRISLIDQGIIEQDFSEYISHLTFCIFEDIDTKKAKAAIQDIAEKINFPTLRANSIHTFKTSKKVACITVEKTKKLEDIQKFIFDTFKPFCSKPSEYYTPENWVPHITLAFDTDLTRMEDLNTTYENMSPILPMKPFKFALVEFYPVKDIQLANVKAIQNK